MILIKLLTDVVSHNQDSQRKRWIFLSRECLCQKSTWKRVPLLNMTGGRHRGSEGRLVVAQSLSCIRLFATPWTAGFPVLHHLPELLRLISIKLVMPSNHLILCRPLLLLPSIFPSIRVFSNESVLHIRWPKYWSFSFSTSPSSEHSGLISFRMDWLDLL